MSALQYFFVTAVVITITCYYTQADGELPYVCDLFFLGSNGACENGQLVCDEGVYSHQCDTAHLEACFEPCFEAGTLFGDEGFTLCSVNNFHCICKDGYRGYYCDEKLISANCTDSQIAIQTMNYQRGMILVPYNLYFSTTSEFTFESDHACAYENIEDRNVVTLETGTAETTEDDSCDIVPTEEDVAGQTVLSVYMYFQYTSAYQLAQDPVYKISCTVGSDVAVVQSQFDIARELTALPSTHSSVSDISMDLKVPNDEGGYDVITQETVLNIGDRISLIVQRPASEGDFTVTNCEAASGSSFENSIYLLEDLCVDPLMAPLYSSTIEYQTNGPSESGAGGNPNNKVVHLPLIGFVMRGSSSIHLRCVVCTHQDCTIVSPDCLNDIANALNINIPNSRKRRAITRSSEIDLAVSVEIRHPGYTQNSNSTATGGFDSYDDASVSVMSCYKSVAVVLPVSLLAGLLLVTMVMTFFFCAKLTNHEHLKDVNSIKKP